MLGYHPPTGPGRHPPDQADTPTSPDQADPPWDQADSPDQADTPLGLGRPPLGPGRPPGPGRHPPGTRQTPPGTRPTPLGPGRSPPGSRLQHTVYERPVRILLECILVILMRFVATFLTHWIFIVTYEPIKEHSFITTNVTNYHLGFQSIVF